MLSGLQRIWSYMQHIHVYIARGNNAASAIILAVSVNDAKEQAAQMWNEPHQNLEAHVQTKCAKKGCTK